MWQPIDFKALPTTRPPTNSQNLLGKIKLELSPSLSIFSPLQVLLSEKELYDCKQEASQENFSFRLKDPDMFASGFGKENMQKENEKYGKAKSLIYGWKAQKL